MRFVGFILSGLFFHIVRKLGLFEGIFDVHSVRLNWIHHVARFIWTQSKIAVVHFKRKVESEVEWTTEYQFFL